MAKQFHEITNEIKSFIDRQKIFFISTAGVEGAPNFDYVSDREILLRQTETKGLDWIKQYWKNSNQLSLDGKPTKIIRN